LEHEGEQEISSENVRQVIGPGEVSEDELGSFVRKPDKGFEEGTNALDPAADGVFPAADFDTAFQDEEREEQLQAESPADRPPVHQPQIGGKKGDEAEEKEDTREGLAARADRRSGGPGDQRDGNDPREDGEAPAQGSRGWRRRFGRGAGGRGGRRGDV